MVLVDRTYFSFILAKYIFCTSDCTKQKSFVKSINLQAKSHINFTKFSGRVYVSGQPKVTERVYSSWFIYTAVEH